MFIYFVLLKHLLCSMNICNTVIELPYIIPQINEKTRIYFKKHYFYSYLMKQVNINKIIPDFTSIFKILQRLAFIYVFN